MALPAAARPPAFPPAVSPVTAAVADRTWTVVRYSGSGMKPFALPTGTGVTWFTIDICGSISRKNTPKGNESTVALAANDCEQASSSPIVTFGRFGGVCGCGGPVAGRVVGTSAASAARMLTGSGASRDGSMMVPSSPFAATLSWGMVTVAFASAPWTTKERPAPGTVAPVGMVSVNVPSRWSAWSAPAR